MKLKKPLVVVKGAGDLASGIAYRLFRCGLDVIMTELAKPLVVRRNVSFAAAVYEGAVNIEDVPAKLAATAEQALAFLAERVIPVVIDPKADMVTPLHPLIVVDARMAKRNLGTTRDDAPLVIGLGPGFTAGQDVHAVIETCRGHDLGRVLYSGCAAANTGSPGAIDGHTWERLLRAPAAGRVLQSRSIGEQVEKGAVVAFVEEVPVYAQIAGLIRGMIKECVWVPRGTKIGDIDPRKDTKWDTISDKALAIGGGVLEAVFHFLAFSHEGAALVLPERSGC